MQKKNIPKIIHYCWFGNNPMPKIVKDCIKSWETKCPDYKIKLWNENNFDFNENEYVKQAYDAKKWAFVSDFARLFIIYNEGGVYLDTDVELLKKLDSLLEYDAFFAKEDDVNFNTGIGFGAKKHNNIVKKMLDSYNDKKFITKDGYDLTPCPITNTKVINDLYPNMDLCDKKIIDNVCFLSKEYFCPIDYETGKKKITKNTIAIHHFSQSWLTRKDKIKHFVKKCLILLIGRNNAKKIIKKIKK
ncbi:MAG: glycosyl transferase [Bacilli bacterium]|nr:glycosyl transferase [Bacilli bacterium]